MAQAACLWALEGTQPPPKRGEQFGSKPLRFLAIEVTDADTEKPLSQVSGALGELGQRTTDGSGRLSIRNPPRGRLSLQLRVSGYKPSRQELEMGYQDKFLQIKLTALSSDR